MAKIKMEKDLFKRAVECAEQMGYSSVDEFVGHLVERALAEAADEGDDDQGKVEERLRGLGYLD